MKLSELKEKLAQMDSLSFVLPNGKAVPSHFHVTEIGQIDKRFMDCGGVTRTESVISLQLWESVDYWHKLEPVKLLEIVNLSQQKLFLGDHEIEVEYQAETIGKYKLGFENNAFVLQNSTTACLAMDQCGIPSLEKVKEAVTSCCAPGGGCC